MSPQAKFAGDRLPYSWDFNSFLTGGDSISDVSIVGTPDGLTVSTPSINTDGHPVALISGGVDGKSYTVTCTVSTVAGLVINAQMTLEIRAAR